MNLRGYAAVRSTEVVKLPRGRGATKTPTVYYVYVGHPVTGKVVPVAIPEGWYNTLHPGSRVNAFYHPNSDNVLYLVNNQYSTVAN